MNSHMVIGTSGHIDHGKTALIRDLTGIETDRLRIEQERGITIENGYAHLHLSEGLTVGFIDVPGHEKFIRTMLSGAMGIGAVLLVISADEGIKPQTREHFNILKHIGMTQGIIVITKCDLVDDVTLSVVTSEIKDMVRGTFLENAKVIPYSIYDHRGKDLLIEELKNLAQVNNETKSYSASRIYVDRVFTVKGFGTIVTGTLLEGKIEKNQTLYVYPQGKKLRVKGIQVYGSSVDEADYGQRVALNVSLDLDEIKKGDMMTSLDDFQPTQMMNVWLSSDQSIKHWQRMKFYHGTREILCRVATLEERTIEAGDTKLVQLRLEDKVYAKANDPYILRTYSPMMTVGGGFVKAVYAKKGSQVEGDESEEDSQIELMDALRKEDIVFKFSNRITEKTSLDLATAQNIFEKMVASEDVIDLGDSYYILASMLEAFRSKTDEVLAEEHKLYPLRLGIQRETLKSKLQNAFVGMSLDKNAYNKCLAYLYAKDIVRVKDGYVALPTHQIEYNPLELKMKDLIMSYINEQANGVTSFDELLKLHLNKNILKEVLYHLINYEFLVKISEEMVMGKDVFDLCREKLLVFFEQHHELTVAEYRDLIGYSRKASVAVLEYFDKIQMTKRNENTRTLIKK